MCLFWKPTSRIRRRHRQLSIYRKFRVRARWLVYPGRSTIIKNRRAFEERVDPYLCPARKPRRHMIRIPVRGVAENSPSGRGTRFELYLSFIEYLETGYILSDPGGRRKGGSILEKGVAGSETMPNHPTAGRVRLHPFLETRAWPRTGFLEYKNSYRYQ